MSPYLSIIKLIVNRLQSLIKRFRLAGWIKNQEQIKLHLEKISFPLITLTESRITETGIKHWKTQKGKEAYVWGILGVEKEDLPKEKGYEKPPGKMQSM